MNGILDNLQTDLFLIDPVTEAEKHFKLAWQSNSEP